MCSSSLLLGIPGFGIRGHCMCGGKLVSGSPLGVKVIHRASVHPDELPKLRTCDVCLRDSPPFRVMVRLVALKLRTGGNPSRPHHAAHGQRATFAAQVCPGMSPCWVLLASPSLRGGNVPAPHPGTQDIPAPPPLPPRRQTQQRLRGRWDHGYRRGQHSIRASPRGD